MRDFRKQFSKVARNLAPDKLRESSECTIDESFADLVHTSRGQRLLDFYGDRGLLYALERYGIVEKLGALGYSNLRVTTEQRGNQHELRLLGTHQTSTGDSLLWHTTFSRAAPIRAHASAPTLFVDYCLLQDPSRTFSRTKLPLPAQDHPGLGMLSEVVALTERVAKRLRFGAVALVPQHFHSAIMYSRSLTPVDDAFRDELLALNSLLRGREGLSLAQATWALEWGLVIDADSREKIVWHGKVMANVFAERSKQNPIALPTRLLSAWSPSRYRLMRRDFFARWRAWEQTFPTL